MRSFAHRFLAVALRLPALALVVGLTQVGCKSTRSAPAEPSIAHNVYSAIGGWPRHCKRVAILPLAQPQGDALLEQGTQALEPVLNAEILQTARAEFLVLSPDQAFALTGKRSWAPSDRFPADFLQRLREATGCDAVMLGQLTAYAPYPPIVVGWRLQLIDTEGPRVLWAFDQVINASDSGVAEAARAYSKAHFGGSPSPDHSFILNSPRRFGQFAASVVAQSLPPR
jgi:hypothetical protein